MASWPVCDFGNVKRIRHEIAGYNMDLAPSFHQYSDVQGRFLTPVSLLVITVGYCLVYLTEANSYCMLHLHVKYFFTTQFIVPFFEQPVTECGAL